VVKVSHGSTVGIATGYTRGDRRVGVQVPLRSRILTSPYHNLNSRVQHPAARISIGFTNVYYHCTQLNSLSLSLF
jgi:hypothetical protein